MVIEKAKVPSQNMFWEDLVLFSVVKIPRHVKKIYISILKKEPSQAFLKPVKNRKREETNGQRSKNVKPVCVLL